MTGDETLTPLEQLVLDLEAATEPEDAWAAFVAYRDAAGKDYDPSKAPMPL